jgi:hypothetical protein
MPTPTAQPAATDTADTPPATGEWLAGDYYDQTADWSLDRVADRVHQDLYDVRHDDLLPATAEFEVTPDTDGPIPVLRVTISGLVGTLDSSVIYHDSSVVYESMRVVFGLTNHYNRVNLTRPDQARYIQHITALRPDGAPTIVLVGMMHDAVTPARPTDAAPATDAVPAAPAPQPQPVG